MLKRLGNSGYLGIALGIASTVLFVIQDSITKHLTTELPIPLIIAFRYSAFVVFALWFAHKKLGIKKALQVKSVPIQVFRSALLLIEIGIFALSLKYIGIGQMHAVFASYPLIVTVFSALLLREFVGWRRWLAVVVGFCGTLIIINPAANYLNTGLLIAIIPPILFALYTVVTRYAGRTDNYVSSLLYTAIVGFVMAVPFIPFYWQPIASDLVLWLVLLCVVSVTSHLMLIKALELTEAVILQPFNFLSLVWASLVGYFVYSEILTSQTWIGAIIVISMGVYVAVREYRLKSRRAT